MKMTTRASICIFFVCLAALTVNGKLADKYYPIYKANVERNNHLNGNVLCPDLLPGRTTVLNLTRTLSSDTSRTDLRPAIISANALYIKSTSSIYGDAVEHYDLEAGYFGQYKSVVAVPTILPDGSVALSSNTDTVLLTSDLGERFTPLANIDSKVEDQILIPYQDTYLLRPDTAEKAGIISVLDLTNNISNAHWTSNITCPGTIRNVMIYSPSSGSEVLVVSAQPETGTGVAFCIGTDRLAIDNVNMSSMVDPFITEGVLYVVLENSTVARFNLDTKTFLAGWSFAGYTMEKSMIVHGSKALASLVSSSGNMIVDLVSNQPILTNRKFAGHPTYSIPENLVVFTTLDDDGNHQLMALDWDTWEVKSTGLFDQIPNGIGVSEAVFDGNCTVFITIGNGIISILTPMPISDVVPIIECVDEFNVAYFSYKNNEQDGLRIPYVPDRNALTPDNIAPTTLFNLYTEQSEHYPFGIRVQLQNASATYQWRLEDYLLTFSITPQLACPRNFSITVTFIAMERFNETLFANIVINALVSVTGVRAERVSVISATSQGNSAKRMIRQGTPTLELELEISTGNSSEPTSAEIVKHLITQTDEFNNQVQNSTDAPLGTNLYEIVPKTSVTPQSGVLTQIVPPVASLPPTVPSSNPSPISVPQSVPTSGVVLTNSYIVSIQAVLFVAIALILN